MSVIYTERRSVNETAICRFTPCACISEQVCVSLSVHGVSVSAPVSLSHLLKRSCQVAEEISVMLLPEQFGGHLCRADLQPLAMLTLLHSNKQRFNSKTCYLQQFSMNPGT